MPTIERPSGKKEMSSPVPTARKRMRPSPMLREERALDGFPALFGSVAGHQVEIGGCAIPFLACHDVQCEVLVRISALAR